MTEHSITRPTIEEMTDHWELLRNRIPARQATVGVMGLGYVGLPLAMAFVHAGLPVIGFDINAEKIARLQQGQSAVLDIPSPVVQRAVHDESFRPTGSIDALVNADAILICVPTPAHRNRQPDLSYIESAAIELAKILRPGQLVILESTTYPGTTEEMLVPLLCASGLRQGIDFLVAFSPERIDPGNRSFRVENTPKVVGGLGERAGDLACALYGTAVETVVRVGSPREAEMAKLIENTFRHVNIALANELAIIARRMGVDIWQAIAAASSKPFGFMPFYPGPGVGGHCIPIDPLYLSWKAREMGCDISFIELATRINQGMPDHVVQLVTEALNGHGLSVRGTRILVLGLSYKRDIDDIRESPSLEIIEMLRRRGADVSYHDPYVPHCTVGDLSLASRELTPEVLRAMHCVVMVTDHSAYDLEFIRAHAHLIVDTRNTFGRTDEQIIRL
ncbi:MAG: nucleotide sugar dehydrogenase [Armatimonadota bacterium]